MQPSARYCQSCEDAGLGRSVRLGSLVDLSIMKMSARSAKVLLKLIPASTSRDREGAVQCPLLRGRGSLTQKCGLYFFFSSFFANGSPFLPGVGRESTVGCVLESNASLVASNGP